MTSDKQRKANQANAQKSTGPKTKAGKARSAMNGFEHGFTGMAFIMTPDDHQAMHDFILPYVAHLKPVGPVEEQLARSMAFDQYRLNRIKMMEGNYLAWSELGPLGDKINTEFDRNHHAMTQARAFFDADRKYATGGLYEKRITAIFHKNMTLFLKLQAMRKAEERLEAKERAETKPLTRSASPGSEENGFDFTETLLKIVETQEAQITPQKAA